MFFIKLPIQLHLQIIYTRLLIALFLREEEVQVSINSIIEWADRPTDTACLLSAEKTAILK